MYYVFIMFIIIYVSCNFDFISYQFWVNLHLQVSNFEVPVGLGDKITTIIIVIKYSLIKW